MKTEPLKDTAAK